MVYNDVDDDDDGDEDDDGDRDIGHAGQNQALPASQIHQLDTEQQCFNSTFLNKPALLLCSAGPSHERLSSTCHTSCPSHQILCFSNWPLSLTDSAVWEVFVGPSFGPIGPSSLFGLSSS